MKIGKISGSKLVYVIAGWFIDGTGSPSVQNVIVAFQDGRIVKIIKNDLDTKKTLYKSGADIRNFSDCTVVPALVDAHVHLFMSGTDDTSIRRFQLEAGFEQIRPVIHRHISQHLAQGIVAVRDGGDHQGHAMRYRDQCLDSGNLPIHLKVAGKAWRCEGRYGRLIGRSPRKRETLAKAIERDLASQYPQKPDHVKIVNSGINSLKQFGKQTLPQFGYKEMKDAVKVAKDHGLPVMVHANGYEPVKIAVESGCHSIEHGFFLGEDNLRRMADYGCYWVPTACTMKGYAETLQTHGPEAAIAVKYLDHQVKQMTLAKKLGVKMAVGTDSGSMGVHHGKAVLEELKLFVKAGFSFEEAIGCASKNGAELLGIKTASPFSFPENTSTFLAVKGSPEFFFEQ